MRCRTLLPGLLLISLVLAPAGRGASQPSIDIVSDGQTVVLSHTALLQRRDLREIRIPHDPIYKRPMSYRALPLASLLAGLALKAGEVIEVVASDGFVSVLPPELILGINDTGSVAYLAVEPVDEAWPNIPGKTVSAGPFSVVWLKPEAAGVHSEQWPYAVVSIRTAASPTQRWPALSVDPALAAGAPIRAGQTLFITRCMPCHTLNGAGNAHVGPDLNLPQNPTEYLTPQALHQLIRNPASVRHWPDMKMQGFDKDALSDHDIEQIIHYLLHMAARKKT
ncbi:MAG: c-type cytochrome [Defluviicoccus sp.]